MKSLIFSAIAAIALSIASPVRADVFELTFKTTCLNTSVPKYAVEKTALSNKELLARVVTVPLGQAKEYAFVFSPATNKISEVRRCNPDFVLVMSNAVTCNTAIENGAEPVKYVNVCHQDLLDWDAISIDGGAICSVQGKATVPNGPITAKGGCTGQYHTNTEFCQFQATIGKKFVPDEVCVLH